MNARRITTHGYIVDAKTRSLRIFSERVNIDLWWISLLQPQQVLGCCREVLSPGEIRQAASFHFQRDRDRWVIARGAIRHVLATYLKVSPHELRFQYGGHGKPDVMDAINQPGLKFNLSHSGDFALAAVTRKVNVGVDVELIRPGVSCVEIAEEFFSPRDVRKLKQLTPGQQVEVFFECWTLKEAYLKACGAGLSVRLDSFDVVRESEDLPGLLAVAQQSGEVEHWKMYSLPAPPGYKAAMVASAGEHQIEHWEWAL
jgi:4'-phosphopantetheinyl transferase